MRTVSSCKQIVVSAVVLALAAVLAGCGGTVNKVSTTQAQIERDWTMFFSPATPASQKAQLLQNGQQFAPVIQAAATSPLAQQTKVTVTNVTLESPTRAIVNYTILLAGQPALKNQTGIAVRVNGVWRVSDQSFCSLLSLQGTPPPACRRA
jgi:hypothetical protein